MNEWFFTDERPVDLNPTNNDSEIEHFNLITSKENTQNNLIIDKKFKSLENILGRLFNLSIDIQKFSTLQIKKSDLKLLIDSLIRTNHDIQDINSINNIIGEKLYNPLTRGDGISNGAFKKLKELATSPLLEKLYRQDDIPHTLKINKFRKLNVMKPLIIEFFDCEYSLFKNGSELYPIKYLSDLIKISQSAIQRIGRDFLNSKEDFLYGKMFSAGGIRSKSRNFQDVYKVKEHIQDVVDFFNAEYESKKWELYDKERFDLIINSLIDHILIDKIDNNNLSLLYNFFNSIHLLNDLRFSYIILFKDLYNFFYKTKASSTYILLIDEYLGGKDSRVEFFKIRQKDSGYKKPHYDTEDFKKSVITEEPFTRIMPYFDIICFYLKRKYNEDRWDFNTTSSTILINNLFFYLRNNTEFFDNQDHFHKTDVEVLSKFLNTIPLLEDSKYYKIDSLNKLYSKVYNTIKNCNDKFRKKVDIYLGSKYKRQELFFNRSLLLAREQSGYLRFLKPQFFWNNNRLSSINNNLLKERLFYVFENALNIPYTNNYSNFTSCSDFKIIGDHDNNIKRLDFIEFLDNLFKNNLIIKNSSLGNIIINHTNHANNTFADIDILYSTKKSLIHTPLIKYIYHCEPLILAIEIPLLSEHLKIKGHIDLLSYYNDCIYIIDYKPEIEIIDMFKSLPQIIAYGFLMKNTLLLNDLKIKCISYNEKESWEYDPFNLFSYIQKFFERLGREHPISKKGWFKYFKALDSYFISF